jgi:hypothetical protein
LALLLSQNQACAKRQENEPGWHMIEVVVVLLPWHRVFTPRQWAWLSVVRA